MNKILIGVAALIAALSIGFYIGTKYGSKTETEVVEKEVIKRDVVTIVKEVVRKDGTVERETTTVDKSKEKKSTESSLVVAAPPKLNKVSISALTSDFREQHYGLRYERRLVGPMWLGVSVITKQVYGLSWGMEF